MRARESYHDEVAVAKRKRCRSWANETAASVNSRQNAGPMTAGEFPIYAVRRQLNQRS